MATVTTTTTPAAQSRKRKASASLRSGFSTAPRVAAPANPRSPAD